MIEYEGNKYYSTNEILDFINDEETELSKIWAKLHPNFKNIVLLDQINRLFMEAKKEGELSFITYNKAENAKRYFCAYAIEDVIKYLNKEIAKKAESKVFNINLVKGENK